MICTCGERFKQHHVGELLIHKGFLYSIDSFKCPKCEKKVLGNIPAEPLCVADSEKADKIIEAMAEKGFNTYGG